MNGMMKFFLQKMGFLSWKESIKNLHNPNTEKDLNSRFIKELPMMKYLQIYYFSQTTEIRLKKLKKKLKNLKVFFLINY